jgi:hypothetical protein
VTSIQLPAVLNCVALFSQVLIAHNKIRSVEQSAVGVVGPYLPTAPYYVIDADTSEQIRLKASLTPRICLPHSAICIRGKSSGYIAT